MVHGTGPIAMALSLRPASVRDIDGILPLVRSFHEYSGLHLAEPRREASVRGLLSEPGFGGIWLISADSIVIAYIAICKGCSIEFGGCDGFVDEFFIRRESRGKGLGSKVLELAKLEARKLGIRALHLEVARENTNIRKLYSGAGFTERQQYFLMTIEFDPADRR